VLAMAFLLMATTLVAYANGANDNYKGVATLFGSGTTNYRKALYWATGMTFAGSICAFVVGATLVQTFSGKGLVPNEVVADPKFLISVGMGAGLTVLLATRTGIPISTTHSLIGALAGSGFVAIGTQLNWVALGSQFFAPLLLSPLLAMMIILLLYPIVRLLKRVIGIKKNTCICIGEKIIPVGNVALQHGAILSAVEVKSLNVFVDEKSECEARAIDVYQGRFFGIEIQKVVDGFHFLSAGAVSFARGMNDAPKIVALLVVAGILNLRGGLLLVGFAMAIGGLLQAKRVAQTMAYDITPMTPGQGCVSNFITASLVIFASRFGIPVSTTHISCGALFGLGAVTGRAHWKTIGGITSAWVMTLPVAAFFAAFTFFCLKSL